MITCTVLGILTWALSASHGPGKLIHTGPSVAGSKLSWNTVYGLQSVIGVYGSGCLGQSGKPDWHVRQTWNFTDPNNQIGRDTLRSPMPPFSRKASPHRFRFVSQPSAVSSQHLPRPTSTVKSYGILSNCSSPSKKTP